MVQENGILAYNHNTCKYNVIRSFNKMGFYLAENSINIVYIIPYHRMFVTMQVYPTITVTARENGLKGHWTLKRIQQTSTMSCPITENFLPSEFCGVVLLLLEKMGGVEGICCGCVVSKRSGLLARLGAPPISSNREIKKKTRG